MPIAPARAKELLATLHSEVRRPDGAANVDAFTSLRDVDAKVRELKLLLKDADATAVLDEMEKDQDFSANSRRVRLEAVANYCATALRFLDSGMIKKKTQLFRAPSFAKLTGAMPDLESVLQSRWLEAQKCHHAKAYVAAVVMMGSILEALLLARCFLSAGAAHQSPAAPKDKSTGRNLAISDWTLHALIEVSVDNGWLKSDRAKFSHALTPEAGLTSTRRRA
jgi:hypothetical protein